MQVTPDSACVKSIIDLLNVDLMDLFMSLQDKKNKFPLSELLDTQHFPLKSNFKFQDHSL